MEVPKRELRIIQMLGFQPIHGMHAEHRAGLHVHA